MITLIHGPKGSGKTKRIIDGANDAIRNASGSVIYLTDNAKHSREITHKIRFVDMNNYQVSHSCCVLSFIKGMLASDNDVEKIFIDGFARMCKKATDEVEQEFAELERLSVREGIEIVLTVSCAELPQFMNKYIK